MSYQGVLTDAAGNILPDGTHDFTFRIYDNPDTPGGQLWEESHAGVPVTRGGFSVILGASTSSPNPLSLPFDEPYYLGISVDGDTELLPRVWLASVPYSLRAASVENCSITEAGIASGQVVKILNGLTDDVTLAAGSNVTITPNGQTLVISSTGPGGPPGGPLWHDVRAYGAIGDDSSDDTAAIQAAITAAEADGSYQVLLPAGTYRVTSGLTCRRETTLLGTGDVAIHFDAASGTLLTWASPTIGTKIHGGGASNITFIGGGGTSAGVSFGDPAHPAYYAHRLSLVGCDVTGFGHGIVVDGPGVISTGENSATDGLLIRRCNVFSNVHAGLFVKTNFGIEISTIEDCHFYLNGDAAIQLDSSGGGGGLPSAAINLAIIGTTINVNGDGTLGQIHCPATAWVWLKMTGSSFESQGPGRTHIAALSDGSPAYGAPRCEIALANCYLQSFAPSSYKELIVLAAGVMRIANSRLTGQIPGSGALALIKIGASGQFTTLTMVSAHCVALGAAANARVLDLSGGDALKTSWFTTGTVLEGFSGASTLLINTLPCFGGGDLFSVPETDFVTSRSLAIEAARLFLTSPTDPSLRVSADISKVGSYGRKLMIHSSPDVTGVVAGVLTPVVATSNLEAPGAANDGKIVIEDAGNGDMNLIIYAGGQRFRVDGGAPF